MNIDDQRLGEQSRGDRKLAQRVANAAPTDQAAPAFEAIWARAEIEHSRSRHRYIGFASAAVLAATLVIALNIGTQSSDELRYIHAADLLDGTSWVAPSDALLPDYQFDIYQEFPAFVESTKPVEGALL